MSVEVDKVDRYRDGDLFSIEGRGKILKALLGPSSRDNSDIVEEVPTAGRVRKPQLLIDCAAAMSDAIACGTTYQDSTRHRKILGAKRCATQLLQKLSELDPAARVLIVDSCFAESNSAAVGDRMNPKQFDRLLSTIRECEGHLESAAQEAAPSSKGGPKEKFEWRRLDKELFTIFKVHGVKDRPIRREALVTLARQLSRQSVEKATVRRRFCSKRRT